MEGWLARGHSSAVDGGRWRRKREGESFRPPPFYGAQTKMEPPSEPLASGRRPFVV